MAACQQDRKRRERHSACGIVVNEKKRNIIPGATGFPAPEEMTGMRGRGSQPNHSDLGPAFTAAENRLNPAAKHKYCPGRAASNACNGSRAECGSLATG